MVRLHDVAVPTVTYSKTVVGQGCCANVTATVANLGGVAEDIDASLYYVVANQRILLPLGTSLDNLQNGSLANVILAWNTTGIRARALDFVPDGKVDMKDIGVVAKYFGQNAPSAPPNCDITGPTQGIPDNIIDMRDIGTVAKHFGEIDP